MEQKVLRTGALVVACAIALRLLSGVAGSLSRDLPPKIVSFILFMQTGRVVRPGHISFSPPPTDPTAGTEPTLPTPTEPDLPVFLPEDASAIGITAGFSYTADLPSLMADPLDWDLTGEDPKVLIVHSHGSESYLPTKDYQETTPYHTLNTDYNMISVGDLVAKHLEAAGISVLHDRTLHDEPSYNAAYNNSRKSVQAYLQEYPSICLVLDLHRDSIEDEAGNQVAQTVFSQGETLAPLMLVVGTDYGGLNHPRWQENLSLALKLQVQLEDICPGICRNINLRTQRFNQDLSPGAMLVEVGASGNTRQEALRTAKILVKGIISLAHGSSS
jgi:stage II sporulation protein P